MTTQTARADREQLARSFLQSDYQLKANLLASQYTRMWTRFNFFIVLESGLSAALWAWFKDKGGFVDQATGISWIGLATSICWYAFGAQDRHLVAVYKQHVKDIGDYFAKTLELPQILGGHYADAAESDTRIEQKWFDYIYQWRYEPISTTKLAAWFPLLVCVYWIAVLALIQR
jgi:hypothetical protein